MTPKSKFQLHQTAWVGAIAGIILALHPQTTSAQIAGDGTLGTQVNGSAIAPCVGNCIITNGATRGSNLFHSFRQFSLPNGDFAGFVTTPTIQNVIVRVTGVGQPFISNINGTIATSNPANFFLLNPNGILFGPNAALDIGGSFLATTANRMQFADSVEFRTNDPTPLLTVSVPTGLQMGQTPGTIQMQGSFLSAGTLDSFADFVLVGGDVSLNNAIARTPGRRIELMGIGENGVVNLQLNRDRLRLNLTADTPRRGITLINRSTINTAATTGNGEIVVTGRNITVDRSSIITGISRGTGNAATNRAGDITVNATENLQLTQGSRIANLVDPNATGQGGNTRVTASNIQVRGEGSAILASTAGNGNAGNVQVIANAIAIDGPSGIASQVGPTSNGRGGDVTVQTGSLTLTNGAVVSTSTFGNGNGGDVRVTANAIAINGTTPDSQFVSGIVSDVERTATGRGGDVTVETNSLTLTNGATISANTIGNGNGGNIQVMANTIRLDGITPDGQERTGIASQVYPTSNGDAGDITIQTKFLILTNGAAVTASTGGNGNGGNVQISADAIALDGSGIVSEVGRTGRGRGGDVTVRTDSLSLVNQSTVSANTFGNGNGGNVRVSANTIRLDGSGIASQLGRTGRGRGGDVTVQTSALSVINGAGISASTFGNGNGGDVRVFANSLNLDGFAPDGDPSGIFSEVGRTGNGRGGDVTVQTDLLTLSDRATISSSAFGDGSAGNLNITAQTIRSDRGNITARAASGNGANITLNVRDLLLLRNGSQISTSAGTAQAGGDGGNITINISKGFIVGVLRENSDITANAFTGRGGRVDITAQGVYGLRFQPRLTPLSDITASSQFGISGTVVLNTPDVDPNRGLVALPTDLTDPAQQISQNCTPGSKTTASSFVATGRGGIPLSPDEPLEGRAVVTKWVPLPEEIGEGRGDGVEQTGRGGRQAPELNQPIAKSQPAIVEAQGLIVGRDGTTELIATMSAPVPAFSTVGACPGTN